MTRLGTRFGSNSHQLRRNEPLTDDQLFSVAPSIFAEEAHDSRSERYTYIPTIEVINGLRREGFEPFYVAQSRSRIEGKEQYTKHMLRLRQLGTVKASGEVPEIVLINSHDGTSSYKMMAGIYRFICMNGMMVGDTFGEMKVQHRSDIVNDVIEASYTITDDFERIGGSIDELKSITIDPEEASIFAQASLSLKYDEPEDSPIQSSQLLLPRRWQDRTDERNNRDLWTTFNVVQENMIKGGLKGKSKTGKNISTRQVKSIDTDTKLNKALWTLTEEMAKLKK